MPTRIQKNQTMKWEDRDGYLLSLCVFVYAVTFPYVWLAFICLVS